MSRERPIRIGSWIRYWRIKIPWISVRRYMKPSYYRGKSRMAEVKSQVGTTLIEWRIFI